MQVYQLIISQSDQGCEARQV